MPFLWLRAARRAAAGDATGDAAAERRAEIQERAAAHFAGECLQSLSAIVSERLASWCEAASNLLPYGTVYESERAARKQELLAHAWSFSR